MKHYNKNKNYGTIPFCFSSEGMTSGLVTYKHRTANVGNSGYYVCDATEIAQMLNNPVFFDALFWLDISFTVYDFVDRTHKIRHWKFCEGHDEHHYWFDIDNRKWYFVD